MIWSHEDPHVLVSGSFLVSGKAGDEVVGRYGLFYSAESVAKHLFDFELPSRSKEEFERARKLERIPLKKD